MAFAPSDRQECDPVFEVPDNTPANVRAWFEAEQQRVAKQREERGRALLEEQMGRALANHLETDIQRREQAMQDMFTRARAAREAEAPPRPWRSTVRLAAGSCSICARRVCAVRLDQRRTATSQAL
jgi:hypothetical protein